MPSWKVTICFIASLILLQNLTKGQKNFVFKKCGTCSDGNKYPSDIQTRVIIRDGVQYMSANVSLSQDFGDNVMTIFKIMTAVPGTTKYTKIFETKQTFCKIIKSYVGPFIYELEKRAQVLPGVCPIPRGKYHLSQYPLNINKILVKDLIPEGSMLLRVDYFDIKSNQKLLCLDVEVEVS